jgi:hypothetical protein
MSPGCNFVAVFYIFLIQQGSCCLYIDMYIVMYFLRKGIVRKVVNCARLYTKSSTFGTCSQIELSDGFTL